MTLDVAKDLVTLLDADFFNTRRDWMKNNSGNIKTNIDSIVVNTADIADLETSKLSRDGSLAMTGDFDMGNMDILNAETVNTSRLIVTNAITIQDQRVMRENDSGRMQLQGGPNFGAKLSLYGKDEAYFPGWASMSVYDGVSSTAEVFNVESGLTPKLSLNNGLLTDAINEKTPDTGVEIDECHIKDGVAGAESNMVFFDRNVPTYTNLLGGGTGTTQHQFNQTITLIDYTFTGKSSGDWRIDCFFTYSGGFLSRQHAGTGAGAYREKAGLADLVITPIGGLGIELANVSNIESMTLVMNYK